VEFLEQLFEFLESGVCDAVGGGIGGGGAGSLAALDLGRYGT